MRVDEVQELIMKEDVVVGRLVQEADTFANRLSS